MKLSKRKQTPIRDVLNFVRINKKIARDYEKILSNYKRLMINAKKFRTTKVPIF